MATTKVRKKTTKSGAVRNFDLVKWMEQAREDQANGLKQVNMLERLSKMLERREITKLEYEEVASSIRHYLNCLSRTHRMLDTLNLV